MVLFIRFMNFRIMLNVKSSCGSVFIVTFISVGTVS